jgi:uncharacterized protein YkwD
MQWPELEITRFRALVIASAAACVLALCTNAPSAPAAACPGASAAPGGTETSVLVRATLCLLNQERSRYELRPLRLNPRLTEAAQAHSSEMVGRQYFDHVTPSGATPSARVGATGYLTSTRAWAIGENIMWGTLTLDTPDAAVKAWMHSPGHRANILYGPYRDIGIGVAVGDPIGIAGPAGTYTTDFGVRRLAALHAR